MTIEEATDKVKKLAEMHEGKLGAKVNFSFNEGGAIHLNDTVKPSVVSNNLDDAPCTIKVGLDSFDKMLTGDLNPMMAFMTGKMKVEGDKGVAMKLASLF